MVREEHIVRFSNSNTVYSQADWRILELAHRKACALLDRDPKFDPLAERVALTIMILFERGERDFGLLAQMAAKRERSLLRSDIGSDEIAMASMFLAGSTRPRYLH
jgi:hypothetical protein